MLIFCCRRGSAAAAAAAAAAAILNLFKVIAKWMTHHLSPFVRPLHCKNKSKDEEKMHPPSEGTFFISYLFPPFPPLSLSLSLSLSHPHALSSSLTHPFTHPSSHSLVLLHTLSLTTLSLTTLSLTLPRTLSRSCSLRHSSHTHTPKLTFICHPMIQLLSCLVYFYRFSLS